MVIAREKPGRDNSHANVRSRSPRATTPRCAPKLHRHPLIHRKRLMMRSRLRAHCKDKIFSQRALMHRKPLTIHKLIQESLSSLRSRGGHCFPIRWAARLASRIATIRFACDRVSSRRLARPPRRPIAARYSRTFFSVLVISVTKHPS